MTTDNTTLPPMPADIVRDGPYRVYDGVKYTVYDDGNSADTAYYRDLSEALEALLASFEPDCSYEEWIRIGMAVHHETQGKGFALWDAWSAKGGKYKGAADLRAHWASFIAARQGEGA